MTVVGYPVRTDAEIDAMYEAESARIWEEQNMQTDTEKLKLAARSLTWAAEDFDKCCDYVNEAAEELVDTPEGDKVASVLGEMEILLKEMREMAGKWGADN